jgi:F420-dependent oxidoreductase-like protein
VELGIFVAPQQGAVHRDLVAVARAAEEHGFYAFVRSDHYLANGDIVAPPGPSDAWVSLAGLAVETDRIRLGTMVTPCTFRLPGPLAVIVAQVDEMSRGRAILGLGAGWQEREHHAYGIPFPPTGERFERLEEQLAIVRGFWETPADERFSFQGRHYVLVDVPTLPEAVQQPHPTIVVGGRGARRTPRLAATFADEFNVPPMCPAADAEVLFDQVRVACEKLGRDPASLALSATLTTFCGVDADEVARRGGREPGEFARADLVGTPPEIAEQLHAYRRAGATRVYLRVADLHDVDHVRLLGSLVSAVHDL